MGEAEDHVVIHNAIKMREDELKILHWVSNSYICQEQSDLKLVLLIIYIL